MKHNTSIPALCRALSLLLATFLPAGSPLADDLVIERLTWAGIKLVAGDTTVVIDAIGTDIWEGAAPEGLVPVTSAAAGRGCRSGVACKTADPDSLRRQ